MLGIKILFVKIKIISFYNHTCPDVCFPAFKFQENLLKSMLSIENTFFDLGETCSRDCLIICDRGAMDVSSCEYIHENKHDTTVFLYLEQARMKLTAL